MRIVEKGILNRCEPGTDRATLSFSSVVSLSDGTVLAICRSGSTKDCDDNTTEFQHSTDQGRTWSKPTRPFESPKVGDKRGTLSCCFVTELGGGRLIAAFMWIDRESFPGKSLFNPDTEGCLPMAIVLAESHDMGKTWSEFREVPMPEEIGPPSLTNPILLLNDGTLALSIESNKTYLDASKWYQRVVLFHSTDQGQTWGPPAVAGFDPTGRIYNWDQRLGVAPDGRIAAFLWTYNSEALKYLNIHRRVSTDGGKSWSKAEDMGFTDQPSRPAMLPDGRVVLPWVDRFKTATIRARLASALDAAFDPETEVMIHEQKVGRIDDPAGALGLSVWSFGLPYAEALPDGDVLVVYYAGTESSMDIHYARLRVDVVS